MDIRSLRYFVTVSDEPSLTVAAKRLGISQPALSKSMRELEEGLGVRLFLRSNRGTTLTEAGHLLYDRAKEMISMADRTVTEVRSVSQNEGCDVHIGLGESPDIRDISEAFRLVRERLPRSRLHIYTDNIDEIRNKLESGFIDLAVMLGPVDRNIHDGFSTGRRTSYGVLMRKEDGLAGLERISAGDLKGKDIISLRGSERNETLSYFFGDEIAANSVASYNLINNASAMVRNGVGVAITLDWLTDLIPMDDLVFVPLEPLTEVSTCIVWMKDRKLSRTAQDMIAELKNRMTASE